MPYDLAGALLSLLEDALEDATLEDANPPPILQHPHRYPPILQQSSSNPPGRQMADGKDSLCTNPFTIPPRFHNLTSTATTLQALQHTAQDNQS
jgi:hypothetical protein